MGTALRLPGNTNKLAVQVVDLRWPERRAAEHLRARRSQPDRQAGAAPERAQLPEGGKGPVAQQHPGPQRPEGGAQQLWIAGVQDERERAHALAAHLAEDPVAVLATAADHQMPRRG